MIVLVVAVDSKGKVVEVPTSKPKKKNKGVEFPTYGIIKKKKLLSLSMLVAKTAKVQLTLCFFFYLRLYL